ncbi:hypothetical protein KEM52_001873, partial [Ascosphaera acerosa]
VPAQAQQRQQLQQLPARDQQQQQQPVATLALASTILKACPVYDTVAILIFLLQLPPIVLTLVQFLFASLTFMPPAGISASSLTSNFDIFQGPAGTPSLSTMIAMDAFCLLIWGLFMWTWAQNFAIDLAHVQVAITLGGGSSSARNGTGVNMLCVLPVLALHLVRSQGVQDAVIGWLLSAKVVSAEMLDRFAAAIPADLRSALALAPRHASFSPSSTHPSSSTSHHHHRQQQQPPSWIRSLLAVHILAQAGTAMARRAMAQNRTPTPSRGMDSESAVGLSSQVDYYPGGGGDGGLLIGGAAASASDAASPGAHHTHSHAHSHANTPPAIKETRERISSAKKRRRQANQVRSRQPFWAALASTKVTILRDMSHATLLHPMSEEDLDAGVIQDVWITSIESSAVHFAASGFAIADSNDLVGLDPVYAAQHAAAASSVAAAAHAAAGASGDSSLGGPQLRNAASSAASLAQAQSTQPSSLEQQLADSSHLSPFQVYVNGALWATVSVTPVPQNPDEPTLVRWRGEISGLAPDCTYSCSFVRKDTGAQVSVMSVKTARKPESAAFPSSLNNPPRPSLRPSSPLTTMKNSVISMEEQLAQRRQNLRKAKGDQKATITRLRKEVESYANRLKSASDENKQRQRILQLERTIKQTEEQIQALAQRVKDCENVPELERAEWRRARSRFDSEMERLAELRRELDQSRKASNEQVAAAEAEFNTSVQKRERLQARAARLTEQLERITVANEKGMNERERHAADQLAREQERAAIEAGFLDQITLLTNSVHDYQGRTASLWSQANAIDQAFQAQQQKHQQQQQQQQQQHSWRRWWSQVPR